MSAQQLIAELERVGVHLWEDDGQLRFRAAKGVMTPERAAALRERKEEVLTVLRGNRLPAVVADPANAHAPFPLTDVQTAYLLGRRHGYAYGGVACHLYVEVEYPDLDPGRAEDAWNRLIAHHDMLRAVVHEDGSQQVLPEVPRYRIAVADLRADATEAVNAHLTKVRDELGHQILTTDTWPLFELRLTRAVGRAVLHVSLDFLISDWAGIQILLDQFEHLHRDPTAELPQPELSFRDYLLTERGLRESARYQRDRDYWAARVDTLPPAPELPTLSRAENRTTFSRWSLELTPAAWSALRERAVSAGVTASGAVLAAYAEVIGKWSRRPDFTLNLTLLNRLPLHPDVPALIGDFTSVTLLEAHTCDAPTFADRAQRLGRQLFDDMDHRFFSGVEVIREIARRRSPDEALMPVVFTSAIGIEGATSRESEARLGYGITQTPQVWIDCQALERDGALLVNWDVRDGVFTDGLVDDMFAAFEDLLDRLSRDPEAWRAPAPVPLPSAQVELRRTVNATEGPIPGGLLHEPVFATARRFPDRVAVIDSAGEHTYRELSGRASDIAAYLTGAGVAPGDIVAVALDKELDQIAAVLGVAAVGAAYLPLSTGQPTSRRDRILSDSGAAFLVGGPAAGDAPVPSVAVGDIPADSGSFDVAGAARSPDELAYVIYTSGSTGTPKGVMISHRAALNTIVDITERFGIGWEDRVLGLADLGFDLSVYDLFGTLGVGGTLVLPDPARRGEPAHWAELVVRHRITVWNSVPAQMQMLAHYLSAHPEPARTLRLALLSGDWIPVTLPDEIRSHIPELKVISLGGATEASIWSIYHPIDTVDTDAPSIPYGLPLRNQTFHVYDHDLRDRPDWVAGELYIGGVGVAAGYLNDPERTRERFRTHPVTGERLYRTGDFGRYLPSGVIEFLGREDNQVKIRGHRIELAEVEAALLSHPAVRGAVVLVEGTESLRRRLVAFVVTDGANGGEQPLAELNLDRYLRDLLPDYMCPAALHPLPAIPVTANGKVDRTALANRLRQAANETTGTGGDEPTEGLETTLAQLWAEVLKVDRVGRNDDFFALGGNSLLSTQLVAMVRERVPQAAGMYFDSLVRELLPDPTVAAMARLLSNAADAPTPEPVQRRVVSPLVRFGDGESDPAVVLVHDATGKLYNFVSLTNLIEPGRKILGLTAGDADTYLRSDPEQLLHRRVAAYARLVRTERPNAVQVVGYGATALLAVEVARELAEAGTRVDQVVLVDPYRISGEVSDAALEYLFARELGVPPTRAGFPDTLAELADHTFMTSSAERIAAMGAAVEIGTDITVARRYEIFRATVAALREHELRPCGLPLTVVGSAPDPELGGLAAELRDRCHAVEGNPGGAGQAEALAGLLNGAAV
ncbi:non-ribosomal peptide synthetase [Micromonospora andamanensis]|uniref:non-ribosomal peptide synthetase n=3 Tax=Micromonospora andamanensis TaxID=1287068 RepID=UPI001950E479|nr:non-ribosomal peptide synthetase [Micromonospora andamanensis]GIJ42518.1 hypothetical protein Vwe01_58430 [Micromonospora andamanensis]